MSAVEFFWRNDQYEGLVFSDEEEKKFLQEKFDHRIEDYTEIQELFNNMKIIFKDKKAYYYLHGSIKARLASLYKSYEKIFSIYPVYDQEKISFDDIFELNNKIRLFITDVFGIYDGFLWFWYYAKGINDFIDEKEFKSFNPFNPDNKNLKKSIAIIISGEKKPQNKEVLRKYFKKMHPRYKKLIIYRDFVIHHSILETKPFYINDIASNTHPGLHNSVNSTYDLFYERPFGKVKNYMLVENMQLFYSDVFYRCLPLHVHRQVVNDLYEIYDFCKFITSLFPKANFKK